MSATKERFDIRVSPFSFFVYKLPRRSKGFSILSSSSVSQDLCHGDTAVDTASINASMPPLPLTSTFFSDVLSDRNPFHVFFIVFTTY